MIKKRLLTNREIIMDGIMSADMWEKQEVMRLLKERDMKCTLNWDLIPAKEVKATLGPVDGIVLESAKKPRKEPKEPDPAVIKVFDVEAQAWRSFRMDRLKKITAELVFE